MKQYRICIILICFLYCSIGAAQPLSRKLDLLFDKGKILYEEQKYAEATEVFNQLIEEGKAQKNPHLLTKLFLKLGVFYDNKKNHNKSLECLFKGTNVSKNKLSHTRSNIIVPSVDSNEKVPPPYSPQEAEVISNLYNKIGGVYYNQKNYKKAEKYWKIAYSIAENNQQAKPLSNTLNNLGEIKRINGDFQAALPLYKEALTIKTSIKDSTGMNISLSNIGAIYIQLGKRDSAKLFYDQSYRMAQISQAPKMLMTSHMDYALYYKSINQSNLATQWTKKTLALAQNYSDLNVLLSTYKELSATYEQQNRLDSCLFFQKKWIELSKVINQQRNEKLALEIEAEFLVSEKEKELAYLKDKNKIEQQNNQLKDYFQWAFILGLFIILAFTLVILRLRNKKNEKLADSLVQINQQNKEKDLLLKEIHHRVKNNLQVITSLLSLQSYNIADPATKELFNQSQHRINSMAMIHEMLYQSNDFSKINYKNYLEQLLTKLVDSFKGHNHQIQLELDVPKVFLNIDTAIPLGLLINEIITNALKYGLPDDKPGILSVKMKSLDSPNFLLEIGDNGIGYSGDFKSQKHSSLGLRLIQQLTIQLNGTIEKDTHKTGTHYVLQFQEIEAIS
jgi:two-component sensor histidine kinase